MALVLDVIDGLLIGQKFFIKPGLTIGRKTGEILLSDEKVSGIHATIELEDNDFVLVDQGSSNGTFLNGNKVNKVTLRVGVVFQIGKTIFSVMEIAKEQLEELGVEEKSWKETLIEKLENIDKIAYPKIETLVAFPNPLRLTFTRGPHTDSFMTFGYGPRTMGFGTLDQEILDPELPGSLFELIPTGTQVLVRNLASDKVLLNKLEFDTERLMDGDTLYIGKHVLKASYL